MTDSPWYWVYLFCTGGLIALVMIGPKYTQRQVHIEQNVQKRQRAAQLAAGQSPDDVLSPRESPTVMLWPLFVVLGLALSLAWIKLIRDHFARRGQGGDDATTAMAIPGEAISTAAKAPANGDLS